MNHVVESTRYCCECNLKIAPYEPNTNLKGNDYHALCLIKKIVKEKDKTKRPLQKIAGAIS